NVERMGETGDPWGIPFSTCFMDPLVPSRQTAAWRCVRKDAVHLTYWMGIPFRRSSHNRRSWLTKSKYPFISNVSADVTFPWFHAAWTSFVKVRRASVVDEFERPPNCVLGTRLWRPARYVSLRATIFSNTLPMHSRSWIRR
ncbi:hypothetical protein B0H14DRAFT_2349621, partial [Mycena olivaceomarginata]